MVPQSKPLCNIMYYYYDRSKKVYILKFSSESCGWTATVVGWMFQIVGVLGLKLVGWIFFDFFVVLQPHWSWSIKDLNLDILRIEAARWKDTVSKCKCKDAKFAQFWELIILELHLGETLNLSKKKFEKFIKQFSIIAIHYQNPSIISTQAQFNSAFHSQLLLNTKNLIVIQKKISNIDFLL